jgi:hypothetical protein
MFAPLNPDIDYDKGFTQSALLDDPLGEQWRSIIIGVALL